MPFFVFFFLANFKYLSWQILMPRPTLLAVGAAVSLLLPPSAVGLTCYFGDLFHRDGAPGAGAGGAGDCESSPGSEAAHDSGAVCKMDCGNLARICYKLHLSMLLERGVVSRGLKTCSCCCCCCCCCFVALLLLLFQHHFLTFVFLRPQFRNQLTRKSCTTQPTLVCH